MQVRNTMGDMGFREDRTPEARCPGILFLGSLVNRGNGSATLLLSIGSREWVVI